MVSLRDRVVHSFYTEVPTDDDELATKGGKYQAKFAVCQVTIRVPEYSVLNWVAVAYGFIAFFVGFAFPVMWLLTGRFVWLWGVVIQLVCVLISELMLKPFLKDPRPPETANRNWDGSPKFGMPSGHCLAGMCVLVWMLLELELESSSDLSPDAQGLQQEWVLALLLLLAPIPWSRWHNRDHTAVQCVVGSLLGAIIGVGGYLVRKRYFSEGAHYWPWDEGSAVISAAEHAKRGGHAVLLV